jgi:hypothetical protein
MCQRIFLARAKTGTEPEERGGRTNERKKRGKEKTSERKKRAKEKNDGKNVRTGQPRLSTGFDQRDRKRLTGFLGEAYEN